MTLPTKESLEGWRIEQKMAYLRIRDATNIIFESAVQAIKQRDEALKTIKDLEATLHAKNKALDALHYVWCSGGCDNGVDRYTEDGQPKLTEELLREAEFQVSRMRTHLENAAYRSKNEEDQR